MFDRVKFKENAKQSLSNNGNWGKAIILLLIFSFVEAISSFDMISWIIKSFNKNGYVKNQLSYFLQAPITSRICVILGSIVIYILTLGTIKICYKMLNNQEVKLIDAFYYFSNLKLISKGIVICIIDSAISLILSSLFVIFAEILSAITPMLSALLTLVACCLMLYLTIRFSLIKYCAAYNDSFGVIQLVSLSWKATKGHVFNLIWLVFSFILWFISCIFILPMLYVSPYFFVTEATAAKYLIENLGEENLRA